MNRVLTGIFHRQSVKHYRGYGMFGSTAGTRARSLNECRLEELEICRCQRVRGRVFTCKQLIDLGKMSCQITSVTYSMQLNQYNKLLYTYIMQIKCTKGICG